MGAKIDELIKAARQRSMTPEAIEAFKQRVKKREKSLKKRVDEHVRIKNFQIGD